MLTASQRQTIESDIAQVECNLSRTTAPNTCGKTLAEMMAHLATNYTANSFAMSVLSQYNRRGTLSDKQVAAIDKMIARDSAPKPVCTTNYTAIVGMFNSAFNAQLRRPRMSFAFANGDPLVLSVNASRSFIYVTDGGGFGSNRYFGKVSIDTGVFTAGRDHVAEVTNTLNTVNLDPLAAATAHGKKSGRCCFCNRQLTDGESVGQGYGPVCATKYGLA